MCHLTFISNLHVNSDSFTAVRSLDFYLNLLQMAGNTTVTDDVNKLLQSYSYGPRSLR